MIVATGFDGLAGRQEAEDVAEDTGLVKALGELDDELGQDRRASAPSTCPPDEALEAQGPVLRVVSCRSST